MSFRATPPTQLSRRQFLRGSGEPSPQVTIAAACLAFNGVDCRLCDDACDQRAIRFRPRPGGAYTPSIDTESCTACGECLAVCPVGALTTSPQVRHD